MWVTTSSTVWLSRRGTSYSRYAPRAPPRQTPTLRTEARLDRAEHDERRPGAIDVDLGQPVALRNAPLHLLFERRVRMWRQPPAQPCVVGRVLEAVNLGIGRRERLDAVRHRGRLAARLGPLRRERPRPRPPALP